VSRRWLRKNPTPSAQVYSAKLLPDLVRVFGRDHPDVLTTRNNIAALTERRVGAGLPARQAGKPAAAP